MESGDTRLTATNAFLLSIESFIANFAAVVAGCHCASTLLERLYT
jgi:hypothetical protein